MLDVARHFYPVDEVKKYIDDIAMLKLNVLHLHLTDDQGWRIEIKSWPRLTEHGGSTAVDGNGGFYTQEDYREIVEYAASRFVTIVPEIDLPGHTNAALASYPELNCDGVAPELYEGTEVGFSSLCLSKEVTDEFVSDVIREVSELSPGPWIHFGGDEASQTPEDEFRVFIARTSDMVAANGKTPMGWHEIGRSSELAGGTVGQYWGFTTPENDSGIQAASIVEQGGQLVMSPADVAYLDMKYDEATTLGLVWAQGPTSVTESYSWEPTDVIPGVGEANILGVEAPIWSETLTSIGDVEFMAFPRIAAIAEIAWSPRATRDYTEFAARLAELGERLDAAGITYHRAPDVPWPNSPRNPRAIGDAATMGETRT
jgi:hexosaminidase